MPAACRSAIQAPRVSFTVPALEFVRLYISAYIDVVM